ncbi:MAG: phenylacetic acid degradation protein PaaD [Acidimicrobiia bacterium]|nr:MAG: phenylacetic acid degradation protein PaaD [Acidimicrobiia bacterium]
MVTVEQVREAVARIPDPEIPAVTIDELGILRGVEERDGKVVVKITPTYSGCPALDAIREEIRRTFVELGVAGEVETVYSPAWTTDWIDEHARRRLESVGIAPPVDRAQVTCPRCRSGQPRTVSEFGSTACKALMVCSSCGEPFDWFKPI